MNDAVGSTRPRATGCRRPWRRTAPGRDVLEGTLVEGRDRPAGTGLPGQVPTERCRIPHDDVVQGTWTPGECANCGRALGGDASELRLFCSDRCRRYAHDVRYYRRCRREGRWRDPDVREALQIRLAHLVGGGYDEEARSVAPTLRAEVLAANDGRCVICNYQPALQVDHIDGSSSDRNNLQGVCEECHFAKTRQRMQPIVDPAHEAVRQAFLDRVNAGEPERACDDDESWEREWPELQAAARFPGPVEEIKLTAQQRAALGWT